MIDIITDLEKQPGAYVNNNVRKAEIMLNAFIKTHVDPADKVCVLTPNKENKDAIKCSIVAFPVTVSQTKYIFIGTVGLSSISLNTAPDKHGDSWDEENGVELFTLQEIPVRPEAYCSGKHRIGPCLGCLSLYTDVFGKKEKLIFPSPVWLSVLVPNSFAAALKRLNFMVPRTIVGCLPSTLGFPNDLKDETLKWVGLCPLTDLDIVETIQTGKSLQSKNCVTVATNKFKELMKRKQELGCLGFSKPDPRLYQ